MTASSPIIECAIGIVLLWFLAASLCSLVVELVATAFHFRANQLWRSIARLLGPTNEGTPGVALSDSARLAKSPESSGSAMENFVKKLPGVDLDSITKVKDVSSAAAAQALIAARAIDRPAFDSTQLGSLIKDLPDEITSDALKLRDWLERWYDGAMTSVSASYRRHIRWWTALAGLIIVVACGLDSVAVAQKLYRSPTERALLVAQADRVTTPTEAATGQCDGTTFDDRLKCARHAADDVSNLRVSFWQSTPDDRNPGWLILLGVLATWAATAAGAPFWFDLLTRLTGLRSSSKSQAGA